MGRIITVSSNKGECSSLTVNMVPSATWQRCNTRWRSLMPTRTPAFATGTSCTRARRLNVPAKFSKTLLMPPADALLADLARTDPTLLPFDLHVTYWDRLV